MKKIIKYALGIIAIVILSMGCGATNSDIGKGILAQYHGTYSLDIRDSDGSPKNDWVPDTPYTTHRMYNINYPIVRLCVFTTSLDSTIRTMNIAGSVYHYKAKFKVEHIGNNEYKFEVLNAELENDVRTNLIIEKSDSSFALNESFEKKYNFYDKRFMVGYVSHLMSDASNIFGADIFEKCWNTVDFN